MTIGVPRSERKGSSERRRLSRVVWRPYKDRTKHLWRTMGGVLLGKKMEKDQKTSKTWGHPCVCCSFLGREKPTEVEFGHRFVGLPKESGGEKGHQSKN